MSGSSVDLKKFAIVNSLPRAVALYDFEGSDERELSFHAGDNIRVLGMPDGEWWQGEFEGRLGWFPKSHVQVHGRGEEHKDSERASEAAEESSATEPV
jgi:hypothetical protein